MATDRATIYIDVQCPPPEGCECDSPYDPSPWPTPGILACTDGAPAQRMRLRSTHALHATWGADGPCMDLKVDRIVECAKECGIEELRHCWPQGCGVTIMPPGLYEISIPPQMAYPLEPGAQVEVTVVFEPLSDEYLAALSAMNSGAGSCCKP